MVQSEAGMLALNISGKLGVARSDSSGMLYSSVSLKDVSLLFEPAETLMEAQFMYISRVPTLLNHVQASVYAPGSMPCGIVYLYLSGSPVVFGGPVSGKLPAAPLAGQPLMIEWMTIHFESFVAGVSLVKEIWQEPPPWTAEPLNDISSGAPMTMLVTGPPVLLVALQGKSEPLASRGLLLGLP